jgi:hypothetical protein
MGGWGDIKVQRCSGETAVACSRWSRSSAAAVAIVHGRRRGGGRVERRRSGGGVDRRRSGGGVERWRSGGGVGRRRRIYMYNGGANMLAPPVAPPLHRKAYGPEPKTFQL